jgi:RecA-family ATPase
MDGLNLLEALAGIDPTRLSYQEWVDVGFALKQEGFGPEVWEQWSARDAARYHPGECLKKWSSFNGASRPVTGGTIVQYAMNQGWRPNTGPDAEIGWDDAIGGHGDELKVIDGAWLEEKDIPQPPEPFDGVKQLIRYLSLLFEAAETVGYVTQSYTTEDGRRVPTKGAYDRTAGQLIEELNKCHGDLGAALGDYDPDTGAWIRFNPLDGKGVKNENVTEYRYALVESDTLELSRQYSLMLELQLPIVVMVHSGGKSIHAIVRIDAQDYDEYRQRVDYLYAVCQKNGMQIDRQNRNPSRLSRMPGVMRKGKPQYILAENIGCESFTAWKEYIEGLNDDLPDMENLEDQLKNLPPLAPELIQGVLRKGHKLLLSGPSKAGKSFALIELCIAIAEGIEWLGLQCAPGGVLYVNLELDRASCLHRFQDVYKAMGVTPRNPDAIDIWNLRGRSCPMDKLSPKLIRRSLKKGYTAVIIDPIYKVITGDENSADQMAAFCNQFDKICTELGCAVIYCHHHSKGSQGQKRSMDRASGSGVFARDPDALLDLIELDIPQQSRDEMVNRITRDACIEYLRRWGKLDEVSQDDQCNHVRLMDVCKELLPEASVQRMLEEAEPKKEAARYRTGWRLEGVLREFRPMNARYLWFEYPVHRADESGLLKDLAADGEKHGSVYKAQAARREKAKAAKLTERQQIENALAMANGGEPCTVKDLAEYMAKKEDTMRRWINRNDFEIDKNSGTIRDLTRSDGGMQ